MNRPELVAAVAAETGHTPAPVNGVVDAIFDVVTSELKKGTKVSIPGWLSFERTHRAARMGRNPQTGASIQIAASNGVKVSAGSKLKASVK